MGWIYLIIAGAGEVGGVMSLKAMAMKKSWKALLALSLSFGLSFFMLSLSFQSIPMSTAYAVWTGIGTVGSATLGIIIYKESKSFWRLFFISLILIGAVGLKLFS